MLSSSLGCFVLFLLFWHCILITRDKAGTTHHECSGLCLWDGLGSEFIMHVFIIYATDSMIFKKKKMWTGGKYLWESVTTWTHFGSVCSWLCLSLALCSPSSSQVSLLEQDFLTLGNIKLSIRNIQAKLTLQYLYHMVEWCYPLWKMLLTPFLKHLFQIPPQDSFLLSHL